jgi:hypothetical protein
MADIEEISNPKLCFCQHQRNLVIAVNTHSIPPIVDTMARKYVLYTFGNPMVGKRKGQRPFAVLKEMLYVMLKDVGGSDSKRR